ALRGPGDQGAPVLAMMRMMRLSTGCSGRRGKRLGTLRGRRFVPNQVTGKAGVRPACPELVPHSARSVKPLDIHTLHSACCYGLLVISIKRNALNGGQLS